MASTASSAFPGFTPLTSAKTARVDGRARRDSAVAIEAREALGLWRRKKVVFVDLRDWEMVDANGWIEGSLHCPAGEFATLIDPSSPLHARLFEPGKIFIFYGGPQTAPLAAAKRARALGLKGALALRGGLRSWRNAGGRVGGHPDSPFPALKASFGMIKRYAENSIRRALRSSKRRSARTGRAA